LSAPTEYIKQREDYFYKVDILQNGKVLYEQIVAKEWLVKAWHNLSL